MPVGKISGNENKSRYCVLFTQVLKQWDVTETIRRALPQGRGTVFYPCTELWMGSLEQTVIEPLFPGYVFIRSDMGRKELHGFIRSHKDEIGSFVKELWRGEKLAAGEDVFDSAEDSLADLNDDEAKLLDFMLGFQYRTEAGKLQQGAGVLEGMDLKTPEIGKNGKKIWQRKIPETGVLGMSYGYKEKDGRYVVMEGPLRGHEDRIVDVNLKDRRAYLNLKVGGRLARVGLTIMGKKHWFLEDKEALDVLGDGTEVDCRGLASAMMGLRG